MTTDVDKPLIDKKRRFRILSIDGGGIKGLIPATLLSEIRNRINGPIWSYFDLICGTSTGGIIALGLGIEKPISDVANLYTRLGSEIFPVNGKTKIKKIKDYVSIILGSGALYDSKKLETILRKEFSKGNVAFKMEDSCTRLCIPSIDITNGKVRVYKTPHSVIIPREETYFADRDKEMWQVAMATSAAPTFFKPAKVKSSYFVDGGLWANNPSLVGVIEGLKTGYDLEEIYLLSLGTGETTFQVAQHKAERFNLKSLGVSGLVELSYQSQSQAVQNQIMGLLGGHDRYLRVQHQFQSNVGMDDASRLEDMKAAGYNLYIEYGAEIMQRFFDTKTANSPYKAMGTVKGDDL